MSRAYLHDGGPAQGHLLIPASQSRESAEDELAVADDRVEDYRDRRIAATAAIAHAILDLADAVRSVAECRPAASTDRGPE